MEEATSIPESWVHINAAQQPALSPTIEHQKMAPQSLDLITEKSVSYSHLMFTRYSEPARLKHP